MLTTRSDREEPAMKRRGTLGTWMAALAVAAGLIGLGGAAEGADLKPGAWTYGAGFGFLRETPDGTAFALNVNAETFLIERLSVGPLLHLGFTAASPHSRLSRHANSSIHLPTPSNLI